MALMRKRQGRAGVKRETLNLLWEWFLHASLFLIVLLAILSVVVMFACVELPLACEWCMRWN